MFGKKKKTDSEDWKELKTIVDAIFTDTKSERDKMTSFLKQWRGELWDEDVLNKTEEAERYKSKAQFNMLFSTVEQIAPMLTDSKPITKLIPRVPYFEKLAMRWNKVFDYLWDGMDMQTVTLKALLSAMIMKKGIFKIYFDPKRSFGGDVAADIVDPRDFFIAPGYTDVWDAPYCGVRTTKDLLYIKKNFPEAEKVEADEDKGLLSADDSRKAFKYGESSAAMHSAHFTTLYEVWMRDEETMQAVLDESGEKEVDEEGREKKEQMYPYGKFVYFTETQYLGTYPCDYVHDLPPYVTLDDYVDPFDFLGFGEIDQIEGLNKELNLQFTYWMDHTRMYHAPNYTVDTDQDIDVEQVKQTYHKGDQVYAISNQSNKSNPAIQVIENGQLDPSVYQMFINLSGMIEEISGVTEVSKGEVAKNERQSASEISMLMESSHTRTRQKIRNLETALKRVGYMVIKLAQQYYTEPRSTYTLDDEGNVHYQTIGNSREQAANIIAPNRDNPPKGADIPPEQRKAKLPPEEQEDVAEWEQEMEDYKELVEAFGEADPIMFEFDIIIQTNSTLPLDKQSLANLFLRLFQMKAIDAQAVLEMLQVPGREEIIKRMEAKMKAAMKAKGAGAPQGR